LKNEQIMIFLPKKMDGRSLIEVMIALALGLVILIAISSLFLTNRQTYRSTDDKARINEEGYLALSLISSNVRMAGFGNLLNPTARVTDPVTKLPSAVTITNFTNAAGVAPIVLQGCANGFVNTGAATVACTAGTGADAILVRYVVSADNANVSGAAPTDCLGAAITITPATVSTSLKPAAPAYYAVENRFFVQNSANGIPELYCRGNGGTVPGAALVNPAQPLAENVELINITYGVSTTLGSQSVERYYPANTVPDWNNVISARICLVVRSANDGITATPQSYRNCGDALVVAGDRRLRSVFSTTVVVRNRSSAI
jgi:type IV pilus assembly protein PilW